MSFFDKDMLKDSVIASFKKLNPKIMVRNPIMFTVEIATFAMLLMSVYVVINPDTNQAQWHPD